MKSFKDTAHQLIQEAGRPLHYREMTDIAIKRELLKSEAKKKIEEILAGVWGK